MKMTTEQLLKIEAYLDSKELVQIDLRNEVLDHMANGIENSMNQKNLSFTEALELETKKWNHELVGYSSSWLGWAYHGPKIMMQKCVKKTKKVYLKTSITAFIIAILLYNLIIVFNFEQFKVLIKNTLGISYIGILCAMLYFHLKIKKSAFQTSYSYLFKIHAAGVGFVFLIFNPLWANFNVFQENEKIVISILFMHSFFITFSFIFWNLYVAHMRAKKFEPA